MCLCWPTVVHGQSITADEKEAHLLTLTKQVPFVFEETDDILFQSVRLSLPFDTGAFIDVVHVFKSMP